MLIRVRRPRTVPGALSPTSPLRAAGSTPRASAVRAQSSPHPAATTTPSAAAAARSARTRTATRSSWFPASTATRNAAAGTRSTGASAPSRGKMLGGRTGPSGWSLDRTGRNHRSRRRGGAVAGQHAAAAAARARRHRGQERSIPVRARNDDLQDRLCWRAPSQQRVRAGSGHHLDFSCRTRTGSLPPPRR